MVAFLLAVFVVLDEVRLLHGWLLGFKIGALYHTHSEISILVVEALQAVERLVDTVLLSHEE